MSGSREPLGELFSEGRPERLIILLGNPNVGKSTLFNHLTGLGVVTAHYPGKTIEVNIGTTHIGAKSLTVVDLPGVYGLGSVTEAEEAARQALLQARPDVLIVVVDATNLQRNLVLVLQAIDMGLPVVVALNLCDEARRAGVRIDTNTLALGLSVPVFETIAVDGRGVSEMMEYVALMADGGVEPVKPSTKYGDTTESVIEALTQAISVSGADPFMLEPRSVAIQIVEGHQDVRNELVRLGVPGLLRVADEAASALESLAGESTVVHLSRERYGEAGILAEDALSAQTVPRKIDFVSIATRPLTGIPLLFLVLGSLFALLFFVGEFLAGIVSSVWATIGSPLIQAAVEAVAGEGVLASTLLWGLDAGLEASLAIGIPYILTFYVLLAILFVVRYVSVHVGDIVKASFVVRT